jgi:hypothetical protein
MARPVVPVVALLAALALSACDQRPTEVIPADGVMGDRVAQLEKEVRQLRDERDSAQKAGEAAGLQAQSLGQMLEQMTKRLRALEEGKGAVAAAGTPAMSGGEGSTSTSGGSPAGPTPSFGLSPALPDGSFSDEQVATFRRLDDEAQKRKRQEEQARRLKQFLATSNITLQPAETDALLKLQVSYGEKMQEIMREGLGGVITDADRQERRDKIETLRKQYETDIRAVVPSSDADKIVEAMLRTGSFPRRTDRTGMTGATPQPGR